MRRRMLNEPPAPAERVAALESALDNDGDLWQFGTQTLKAFHAKLSDNLERDISRATEGRVVGAPAADDPSLTARRHAPPSPRARSGFGNETLRGFASGAPPPGFPSRRAAGVVATEASVSPRRFAARQPPQSPQPPSPLPSQPPLPIDSQQQPPQPQLHSPRGFDPPRSPRAPLHGAVATYNQQAVHSLRNGVSPRAHLPQPERKNVEWKVR